MSDFCRSPKGQGPTAIVRPKVRSGTKPPDWLLDDDHPKADATARGRWMSVGKLLIRINPEGSLIIVFRVHYCDDKLELVSTLLRSLVV